MKSGTAKIHMWPWPSKVRLKRDTDAKIPWVTNGPTTDNAAYADAPHLYLQFDEFELPVIASSPSLSVALDLLRQSQVLLVLPMLMIHQSDTMLLLTVRLASATAQAIQQHPRCDNGCYRCVEVSGWGSEFLRVGQRGNTSSSSTGAHVPGLR